MAAKTIDGEIKLPDNHDAEDPDVTFLGLDQDKDEEDSPQDTDT